MRLGRRRKLSFDWHTQVGAVGAAAAVWAGGEYLRLRRTPAEGFEQRAQRMLNRVDLAARSALLRPRWAGRAGRASDALAYFAVPLACALALLRADGLGPLLARDAVRVARAATVTGALNQAVKFVAPRERPFARGAPAASGRDRYGSFFSNHASAVAAMAVASARVARQRGASVGLGLPLLGLAFLVGYLRIAADRHYLTDVLAGTLFGGALGLTASR